MFDFNIIHPAQTRGAWFPRFAMATLFVVSFVTCLTAQGLEEDKKEFVELASEVGPALSQLDRKKISEIVENFEDQVKDSFENGQLVKKVKRAGRNEFKRIAGGKAVPTQLERATLWDDNSDLIADRFESVGLTADPSASYGLLGFMGARYNDYGNVCKNGERGKPLTLRITGSFPKAQYMSMQLYDGRPLQGSKGVGDSLSDYEIVPMSGQNRFATGNPHDEGNFEIFIVPVDDIEDAKEQGAPPNTIYYEVKDYEPEEDGDNSVISAFYRIYLPEGGRIERSDLPKVEGFLTEPGPGGKLIANRLHDPRLNLGRQVHPEFAKLVKSWYSDTPLGNVVSNVARIWEKKESLRWFNVNKVFKVIEKFAGQGASKDLRYEMCFKQVSVGEYVVIRFLAPPLYFGGSPEDNADRGRAVRYWSICSAYYPRLAGLNSLSCDPARPGQRLITVVFGKDRPEARAHARAMGAEFLPDTREESHRVLTLIMRNMLPTNAEELADPSDNDELADPEKKHKLVEAIKKLREASELLPDRDDLKEKIRDLEKELKFFAEVRWMFHGEYRPKGEVYSLREFLNLKPWEDLNEVVGDEK